MIKSITNFFKTNPSKHSYRILEQSRLLISRLNEESGIPVPVVESVLKKDFKDFEDELHSTFRALMALSKRVEEYKKEDNEFSEWFETKMLLTSDHTFTVFNHLNISDYNNLQRYIVDFYREKEISNESIYDIRDKLRSRSTTDSTIVS